MIEFNKVSKSFWTGKQRKIILDQASFQITPQMRIGILAGNGAGKTTIINMMCGIEKPDEGKIRRDCSVSFPLGYMGGVDRKLNALENCRFIAGIYGLDPDYVEAFCRYVCGLEEYFEMPLATYSSGMRSRFTFALLLALEFDIYLIDEGMPSSTDAEFNRKAGDIMNDRLMRSGLVIVSHSPSVLEKYVQSAAVLIDGRLEFFETLEEAKVLYDYA